MDLSPAAVVRNARGNIGAARGRLKCRGADGGRSPQLTPVVEGRIVDSATPL
jgi:hypothetical protein